MALSAITSTIQAQNASFLNLASRAAAVHGELQKIKQLYTQLWRAKTSSVRDPFEVPGREEGDTLGLSALSVK
jgi:nucleoporin p58/p45